MSCHVPLRPSEGDADLPSPAEAGFTKAGTVILPGAAGDPPHPAAGRPQGGGSGGSPEAAAASPPGGAGFSVWFARPRLSLYPRWLVFLDPGLAGCAALIVLAVGIMTVGGPVLEWWIGP